LDPKTLEWPVTFELSALLSVSETY